MQQGFGEHTDTRAAMRRTMSAVGLTPHHGPPVRAHGRAAMARAQVSPAYLGNCNGVQACVNADHKIVFQVTGGDYNDNKHATSPRTPC